MTGLREENPLQYRLVSFKQRLTGGVNVDGSGQNLLFCCEMSVSLSNVIRADSCFAAQADDEPGRLLKRSSLQAIQAIQAIKKQEIRDQEIERSSDRPVMRLRQKRVRAVSDPPTPRYCGHISYPRASIPTS